MTAGPLPGHRIPVPGVLRSEDRYSVPGWWAHRFPAEQVWKLRRT